MFPDIANMLGEEASPAAEGEVPTSPEEIMKLIQVIYVEMPRRCRADNTCTSQLQIQGSVVDSMAMCVFVSLHVWSSISSVHGVYDLLFGLCRRMCFRRGPGCARSQ